MTMKPALITVLLALSSSSLEVSSSGVSEAATAGSLRGNQSVRVVTLQGAAYNRGLTHGKTLRKEIQSLVQTWKNDMEVRYKMPADTFIARFLEKTDFQLAIKKWTPDLLEEVRGIADGSGLDFNTIFAFQLPDELWANGEDVAGEHCTSIGVDKQGGNPAFVAQTMDIPWIYHGYQTLLHVKHGSSGLESFVLTAPGLIGLNGINNARVAIACNTLLQLQNSKDGLPVAFIVRGVLEKKSVQEALEFIHNIKHASGQNYIIGGPDKAYTFECSANKVAQYTPYKGAKITYHTNHPLANDDYSPKYLSRLKKLNRSLQQGTYYCYRFESLEKRLRNSSKLIDLDVIKQTLSSRDIDKGPISNDLTYACTIMVLSENPELHLTVGRPDLTAFKVFRFTTDLPRSK